MLDRCARGNNDQLAIAITVIRLVLRIFVVIGILLVVVVVVLIVVIIIGTKTHEIAVEKGSIHILKLHGS